MDIDAVVKEPITAGVKGLKVGVRCRLTGCCRVTLGVECLQHVFQIEGMMRVILEPLIGDAPLVGGVTFFFIRRPVSAGMHLDWHQSWLPFHNSISVLLVYLLDSRDQLDWCDQPPGLPGLQVRARTIQTCSLQLSLFKKINKKIKIHYFSPFSFSSLSEQAIIDIIASLMVLPNRMCIPLIDQVKVDQMRFPLPRVRGFVSHYYFYFHRPLKSQSLEGWTVEDENL